MPAPEVWIHASEDRKRARLRDRLLYLPGALILVYGFWLTLTI